VPDLALAGVAIAAVVGLALWRPGIAVMALGMFLFAQSAFVRLDALPNELRLALARADEIVLAALLVRTTAQWAIRRAPSPPTPLFALAAFGVIGVASAIVNEVSPVAAAVGIFIAVKAGLWLYVGRYLTVDVGVLARYAYVVGALFVGVVGIAVLQLLGVPLPWQPTSRGGVMTAMTSIWNQHTAFGGALTIAMALSVVAFRLPGERVSASVLAICTVIGIVLSTARRLFVSLTLGAAAAILALPAADRPRIRSLLAPLRRPVILVAVVAVLIVAAVAAGPRIVALAELTWDRYVVDLGSRDRFRLYEGAYQLVEESPLLGRGPATYGSYASVVFDSPAYDEVGFFRRSETMIVGGQLGSIAAEYGILGFLAFAAFVGLLIRDLVPISRSATGTVYAALATAGIFIVTDMVVESVVNPVFTNSFITFFAFVGIGIAMTLHARSAVAPDEAQWTPERLSTRWRIGSVLAALLFLAALGVLLAVAAPT
jgi:O-antigen ligase